MTTDADGWIEHDGSGMPVDGETKVEVRYKYGGEQKALAGNWVGWDWLEGPNYDGNITHYRLVGDDPPADPPASPDPVMTLWDRYAMAALTGLLATRTYSWSEIAADAGAIADAMMTERAK